MHCHCSVSFELHYYHKYQTLRCIAKSNFYGQEFFMKMYKLKCFAFWMYTDLWLFRYSLFYLFFCRFRSSVLMRRECVYSDDEGGGKCKEPSLPGTRHCIRHIMYNVDQQLFTHCTARQPDNTLCRIPVFDVSHELPLCYKHSKAQVRKLWQHIFYSSEVLH